MPRRPFAPPSSPERIPWEVAAHDVPAVLARVAAGGTIPLTEGGRVVAQVAPPPPSREPRRPRPRPVFGAPAHPLPGGEDLSRVNRPSPENELRRWEGHPPDGAAEAPNDACDQASDVAPDLNALSGPRAVSGPRAGSGGADAAANAAILRGMEESVGMIPDFLDPDTLALPPSGLHVAAPEAVPMVTHFAAACDRWHLNGADRAALLGIPLGALERWLTGDAVNDAGTLPPSPADRAALAVELDAALRFVPGAEPDVAGFLRRPGTAPDGVGSALGAMLDRPAGLAAVRAHVVTLVLPRLLATPSDGPGGWGDLTETYPDLAHDPIVAEVRAIREALFAEAGYDVKELFRRTRARAVAPDAAGPRAFGAFAHLLPEGADLRPITDPEYDRLPEDELRAWDGQADACETARGSHAGSEIPPDPDGALVTATLGHLRHVDDPERHLQWNTPKVPRSRVGWVRQVLGALRAAGAVVVYPAATAVPTPAPAREALPTSTDEASMRPTMQDVVRRLQALPDDAQEAIAPRVHYYLTRLEELRALIREGIDSGPDEPLDIEAIKREARGPDEAATRDLRSRPSTPADDPVGAEVRTTREAPLTEPGDDLEEFGRAGRASKAAEGLAGEVWPLRPAGPTPHGGE